MGAGGRENRTRHRGVAGRLDPGIRYLLVLVLGVVAGIVVAGVVGGPEPRTTPGNAAEATARPSPDRAGQSKTVPYPEVPYRAFHDDSWWNTALPDDAPLHPEGEAILDYMSTARESGAGCLTLAGAGNSWGQPIYWATPGDPEYDVEGVKYDRPPEISTMRIPEGAEAAENSDGSMTVYDLERGYVVALTDAEYDDGDDTWEASGATVTYLDSNGLHASTGQSDDTRNRGTHRGNNGATMAVSWDEVRAGAVEHVLKAASGPEVADRFVFPMVGSDGDYTGDDPAVPAQGQRFRIRPDVDLDRLDLDPGALVIARALQEYGFYIGDSSGVTALKLEDTITEGRGRLWNIPADALCDLPFTTEYWDVLAEGYDPS